MLYSIENREDLEELEELASLQNQVEEVHSQEKIGEHKFYENTRKIFEPLADLIKINSEKLTKTITQNSIKNNKALENLKEKALEWVNDKGVIAPYLASSLVFFYTPENKSQFKFIEDPISIMMNDFWINTSIPITPYSKMLTFRDIKKSYNLDGPLLRTANYNFNVTHSGPQDQKFLLSLEKK